MAYHKMAFLFKWKKGTWVICIGFVCLFLFDLISTLSVGELVEYMEANPVFIKAGWMGLIAMNAFALYILLKAYDSKNIFTRYVSLSAFVYISIARIYVGINNFSIGEKVQSGEITKEMVQGVSDSVRMNEYFWLSGLIILSPLLVSMVIYWLFLLDHKVVERE